MTDRKGSDSNEVVVVIPRIPNYAELFTLIRAAGPSTTAKARAVDRRLEEIRRYIATDLPQDL